MSEQKESTHGSQTKSSHTIGECKHRKVLGNVDFLRACGSQGCSVISLFRFTCCTFSVTYSRCINTHPT